MVREKRKRKEKDKEIPICSTKQLILTELDRTTTSCLGH